jgi:serine/threonine-protein kinase
MSPEQADGQRAGPASDLYSLGIVLYEMLTGRVPFQAETPLAVVHAHIYKPLPPPRSINLDLCDEIEAAVVKSLDPLSGEVCTNVSESGEFFRPPAWPRGA